MTASIAGVDVTVVSGRFEEALFVGCDGGVDVRVEFVRHASRLELVVERAFLLEVKGGGGLHGAACVAFF